MARTRPQPNPVERKDGSVERMLFARNSSGIEVANWSWSLRLGTMPPVDRWRRTEARRLLSDDLL